MCVRALPGLRLRGVNVWVWVCGCVGVWVCVLRCTGRDNAFAHPASVDKHTVNSTNAADKRYRFSASTHILQAQILENIIPLLYSAFNIAAVTAIVIVNKRVFRTFEFNFPIALVGELHAIAAHPTHRPHPSLRCVSTLEFTAVTRTVDPLRCPLLLMLLCCAFCVLLSPCAEPAPLRNHFALNQPAAANRCASMSPSRGLACG